MSEDDKYKNYYIHLDEVAKSYGHSSYMNLLENKRLQGKIQWIVFADNNDWVVRKDIADRFVEAELPGTRALPVGVEICGSGNTCCNSRYPDSLYCDSVARRELIFDYLKQDDNNDRGLCVIDFVTHFIYHRGVPCLLRDEASMRLELFELVRAGYLVEAKDSIASKRYQMNPVPQPVRRGPGRPKGSWKT
jgi:hypothetical protein